jgi:hypothetical protein
MKKIGLLILGVIISFTCACQGNGNFKALRVMNSDSTHGTANGTTYLGSDGLLRFMYNNVAYKYALGSHPTYTASNGLTKTGNNFLLGGTLTQNTDISGGFNFTMGFSGETLPAIDLYAVNLTLNAQGNLALNNTGATTINGTTGLTLNGGNGSLAITSSGHTFTKKAFFTPTSTQSGLNVGSLAGNPSSPANGDIWNNSTTNTLNARINGATVSLGSGNLSGSLTSGRAPYATGASTLADEAGYEYDAATNTLLVDQIKVGASAGAYSLVTRNGITQTIGAGVGVTDFSITASTNINLNSSAAITLTPGGGVIGSGYYNLLYSELNILGMPEATTTDLASSGGGSTIKNAPDFTVRAGNAFAPSGNGDGGDLILKSGTKRVGGAGVDGSITVDSNTSSINLKTNSTSRLSINTNGSWSVNSSTGSSGDVLTSNGSGSTPTWQAVATTSPAGSNTQVQYNNSGAFGGDAGMTYEAATDYLTVAGTVFTGAFTTSGSFFSSSGVFDTNAADGEFTFYGADGNSANGAPVRIRAGSATTSGSHDGGDLFLARSNGIGAGRSGQIVMSSLPTSDPSVTDAVWSNNGFLIQGSAKVLKANATLDFPSTSAQSSSGLTITVSGASAGDAVFGGAGVTGLFSYQVTSANTVTITFNNYSAISADPASSNFNVFVFK